MTSIVTVDRYRIVSHDTSTPAETASSALVDAQARVEEELRRPLTRAATTERLPIYARPCGGMSAYPRRIPVAAVPVGAGYRVGTTARLDGISALANDVVVEGWNLENADTALLAFTGGWYGRDDPAASDLDRLPTDIERAIVRVAQGILTNAPAMLEGVTSAQVGTVRVSYAKPTTGIDAFAPGVAKVLRPYEYRPVR